MTRTIGTANLQYTLTGAGFEKGLREVLLDHPQILCLQEAGPNRDRIITKVANELGYEWARAQGGAPVMWKKARYRLRSWRPIRLARAEFVGHIPGRKDRLPASICTEVILVDLLTGDIVVVENFHLTAEVQDMKGGGGYKKDPLHLLRVARHLREKHRLGKRMRVQKRRGRVVFGIGDGNYAGMRISRFVNCWDKRTKAPRGTLGGRAVDIVFADMAPITLWTIPTPSDHDALVVAYI